MRLFVDQLTNLDFSFLDSTRGLVGETWLANIELEGELDEQGMVCDFGYVKKMIRTWLDDNIDHKLLIPTQAKGLSVNTVDDIDTLEWHSDIGHIHTSAPHQAHCFIDAIDITQDSVAQWCIEKLKPLFPSSVHKLTLTFSTENISGPFYHYSHGLKKHGGNCQRIAHGHRSKIEIWENGELAAGKMHAWADAWQDIYIGTEQDCQDDPKRSNNYLFQYTAPQGPFAISIPKDRCYLIDTETTVELIAKHLAVTIKQAEPASDFTVKAYEGIAKGAIASEQ